MKTRIDLLEEQKQLDAILKRPAPAAPRRMRANPNAQLFGPHQVLNHGNPHPENHECGLVGCVPEEA